MKFLGKYWKVLLALVLAGAAVFVYLDKYQTGKTAFETKTQQLAMIIQSLENNIKENMSYADIQDELEEAKLELEASRMGLYKAFPVEMKEEDQIMYILYLEKQFGTEINFSFSKAQPIVALKDGSTLMGLTMTVNYTTTYEGFLEMIDYLATDSRITSVRFANIQYDRTKDMAAGTVTLLLYLIDSELRDYVSPDVNIPETGKDNLFD